MTGGLHTKGITKKSSTGRPLISVITVVYNRVTQLEATVRSVIDQVYENVEYIIIDGGSTDGCLEIIKKYDDSIDYWLSEPDKGIYDAMNKGIEWATGSWINFMNCGDRFQSENALVFFQDKYYDADILYGDAIIEYPTFQTSWKKGSLSEMWKRAPFCHQACFVQSSLMKKYKFSLRFKLSSDFDFLYRAFRAGIKFQFVDQVICLYDYKGGASIEHKYISLQERRRAVMDHGFSMKVWLYYAGESMYIRTTSSLKKILGKNLWGWFTRQVRQ